MGAGLRKVHQPDQDGRQQVTTVHDIDVARGRERRLVSDAHMRMQQPISVPENLGIRGTQRRQRLQRGQWLLTVHRGVENTIRSEERRVGKEWRSRWSAYD